MTEPVLRRGLFRTERERRCWSAAALCVAAIYGLVFVGRPLAEWLRARGFLLAAVGVLFVVAALWLLHRLRRRWPSPGRLAGLALIGALYLVAFNRMAIIEERLHLLEYSVLVLLLATALEERWTGRRKLAAAVAFALAVLLGWGDEGLQALHPERVYDVRDVGLNAGAALLALVGRTAWRASPRQAREP